MTLQTVCVTGLGWGLALCHVVASAHGPQGHGQHNATGPYPVVQTDFGIAGHPKKLRRTVLMEMSDDATFSPHSVRVKEGDTIRFVFRNTGRVHHEWVLGTEGDLAQQAKTRAPMPDAVHRLHVDAGKTAEVVWHFNRTGTFRFACLAAGHTHAGMVGHVSVEPAAAQ